MIGLFTITLQRESFFWALVTFIALQLFIKIIFDFIDFTAVRNYYKRKGNYMSEEDEMIYLYKKDAN